MRVVKFGGTSVRSGEWIDRALDIAESQTAHGLVLVASAMGKTTNRLQEIACSAEEGKGEEAERFVAEQ